VTGSNGRRNVIIGNLLNNYIDPELRISSDTYVIKPTYGEDNTVCNYANDNALNVFLSISSKFRLQL